VSEEDAALLFAGELVVSVAMIIAAVVQTVPVAWADRAFSDATSVNWLEVIKALAPVATAGIALLALRNWQRQDKAKREAEFLDALIEATHGYIVELSKPLTVLELAKISMESHAPTWEVGEAEDIAVKGAIAFIEKNGAHMGKQLLENLKAMEPSTVRLRSLGAKGQVFNFTGYAKCRDAVTTLTWHFDRMEYFAAFIRSSTWNWQNQEVISRLKQIMAVDPEEIRKSIKDSDVAMITFARNAYKRIYG
jgi:hypothetical protein